MNGNATRRLESDASTADQPTTDAGRESGHTVHSAGEWRLAVRTDGSVEARDTTAPDGLTPWTTGDNEQVPDRESHRVGLSVEQLLARYAHETRFDRSPEEHGAALRRGIIDALQSVAADADCGRSECDGDAVHVVHTNAPTGPTTALVCDDHASEGTYATLHALDSATEESR